MLNNLLSVGEYKDLIIGGVIVLLVIIVIVWWIKTRNTFVRLKNKVEEAWAAIDVYLRKRFDLIPNLVATVKGYAKHESETLTSVIAARSVGMAATTREEAMDADREMTSSLKTFFHAVAESYPELKANANFLDLQNQLKSIEGELEAARRYYNTTVKQFNTKIELFPDNIVAARMGSDYTKKPYFEIEDAERATPRVSF